MMKSVISKNIQQTKVLGLGESTNDSMIQSKVWKRTNFNSFTKTLFKLTNKSINNTRIITFNHLQLSLLHTNNCKKFLLKLKNQTKLSRPLELNLRRKAQVIQTRKDSWKIVLVDHTNIKNKPLPQVKKTIHLKWKLSPDTSRTTLLLTTCTRNSTTIE